MIEPLSVKVSKTTLMFIFSQLKLIDFGLARRLTSQGTVKVGPIIYPESILIYPRQVGFCGTVGFMAPEVARCQYRAQPDDLASPASDMFR